MSAEQPPEVQAVLDAAAGWRAQPGDHSGITGTDRSLRDAVDAYRRSIAPPEPFEADYFRMTWQGERGHWLHRSQVMGPGPSDAERWRCTVTPIERVR